jgi:membrane protein implicated in regulation of membrane protease activity
VKHCCAKRLADEILLRKCRQGARDNIPGLTDRICELIAVGWGLHQVLDSNQDFPSHAVFYRWLDKYSDVRDKYARARQQQQDFEADNIIIIADTEPIPDKARVRIDARKWRASKLAPKKYGDSVTQTVQNPDGSAVVNAISVTFVDPHPKS